MRQIKLLVLLILLALFSNCRNNFLKSNDLEKMNLKGKVKLINESTYKGLEKFGEITKGDLINSWTAKEEYKFNPNGYLIKESSYFPSGKLSGEEEWIYDKDNKLITKNQAKSYGGGALELYDGVSVFVLEERIPKYSCTYNDDGMLKERLFFNSSGNLFEKAIYKYNENKMLSSIDRYNSEGKRKIKYVFNYDSNNKVKEAIKYGINGKISYKTISNYDERGHRISSERFNEDGISSGKSLFKYNNKGKIIEEKWSDGETHKYDYDIEGNQTSFIRYDRFGNIIYSEYLKYEYDENKNWIKRVTYESENKKIKIITVRTIDYY